MSTTEKKRWPWSEANEVAQSLAREFIGRALRVEVAGSLRRRKATVGDVELLYIPLIEQLRNENSLFGEFMPVNITDCTIEAMERKGILARRKNVKGGEAFGEKNKLMVHVASGIPVDLFAAMEENWFNYLVCRTGGAQSNVDVASAAQRKGWKWNPYGAGFSQEAHDGPYGAVPERVHTVHSEREVFDFVGLKYRDPMDRV